jgi:Flp pilus assembly protein TadD
MNGVKDLNRIARVLAIAGVLAVTLAGCGKDRPEALIESAKTFSTNGDYRAAVIQLRSALQKQPENGEARFILGNALNEEMDYVTAEKELRKAL